MIILTVALFGMKKGAVAGAIGGGLSDFIGGYFYWVVPTLLIKCMWALVMGLIMHKILKDRKGAFLIGAVSGGVLHIIAYTLVRAALYGGRTAIIEIPALTFQTGAGIVIGFVIYMLLKKFRRSRPLIWYGRLKKCPLYRIYALSRRKGIFFERKNTFRVARARLSMYNTKR